MTASRILAPPVTPSPWAIQSPTVEAFCVSAQAHIQNVNPPSVVAAHVSASENVIVARIGAMSIWCSRYDQ